MVIGVIVVTYNAADVIARCLASLAASEGAELRILVVDNASADETVARVRDWAAGSIAVDGGRFFAAGPATARPLAEGTALDTLAEGAIGLVRSPENLGFAGGVNLGLKTFLAMPEVEAMWILNPDCVVENGTARQLAERARAAGRFGVIGGRVYYQTPPLMIQADGGQVNLWTGTCNSLNQTKTGRDVPPPPEAALDFVVGSHMLASRAFVAAAGLMPERYFLFYEEVEWCLKRGGLPLLLAPGAAVHHMGGHSIGSATINSGPSPLSAYFMARNRVRFVAAVHPLAIPVAFAYGLLKACRTLARRNGKVGFAMLRGLFGLPPSAEMLSRINRAALPAATRA